MSIAEQVLKEMQALESRKQKAIDELLAERQKIDARLKMLGYKAGGRGRPKGSTNKAPKKASKKGSLIYCSSVRLLEGLLL